MPLKLVSKESTSTQADSGDERAEESYYGRTNPRKHKTELCKTFSELGYCNYENRCRFAHGHEELVGVKRTQHFRKRKCNGFWKRGYCLYGSRCQFDHAKVQWEDSAFLKGLEGMLSDELYVQRTVTQSKLLNILSRQR